MLCKSRLERARRSSFVTTTVSPGSSTFSSLANSGRPSVDLPDAFSLKIRSQQAAFSAVEQFANYCTR
jgi:hypothetical protein